MLINTAMLVKERTGFLRVAILAFPVETDCQHRVFDTGEAMTIGAINIFGAKGMRRAAIEFRLYRRMATGAKILTLILDQSTVMISMDGMAIEAGDIGAVVDISRRHRRLVGGEMASSAYLGLLAGRECLRFADIFRRRIIDMLFPAVMTSDTPGTEG